MKVKLTKSQWARISEILGNGGLLLFGSTVIPIFLNEFDILLAIWGMAVSAYLWYISIIAARRY